MARVLVDVDDTVAELLPEWITRYNYDYNDCLVVEKITDWDITLFVKPECGKSVYEYLLESDMYDFVEATEGALEGVAKIKENGHTVAYLTSSNPNSVGPKAQWLQRKGFLDHGEFIGLVAMNGVRYPDKSVITGDVLIDDGVHNLDAFVPNHPYGPPRHGILFDRPHNRTDKRHLRAEDWVEVPYMVEACVLRPKKYVFIRDSLGNLQERVPVTNL